MLAKPIEETSARGKRWKDLKKAKAIKVQTNEGQKNAFDASEIKGLENGYLYYRPKGKGGWVIYSEQDQALIPVNI